MKVPSGRLLNNTPYVKKSKMRVIVTYGGAVEIQKDSPRVQYKNEGP